MSKLARIKLFFASFFVLSFSLLFSAADTSAIVCTQYTKVCPANGCVNTGTATNPNCTCSGNEVNYRQCEDNGSGSCVGFVKNQTCSWNGSSCVLTGPGNDVQVACGDGGGECPAQCRAGSQCGAGFSPASGCGPIDPTHPNFGCRADQVCCRANSCPSGPTPTPNPCTTECHWETDCRREGSCSGGSVGDQCGVDIAGNPKYECTRRVCTTTCPNTPTPSQNPNGYHDASSCTNSTGWACDPSDYSQPLQIHFYVDGPAGGGGTFVGATTANLPREAGVAGACGGNPNHGFAFSHQNLPEQYRTGNHTIYAYAINIGAAGPNVLLNLSPKSYSCPLLNYCQDIRAYKATSSTSWTLLTSTQLSSLADNERIYFCSRGTATTSGTYSAVRYYINNTLHAQSSTRRPGSADDFCYQYTVPAGLMNFSVVGQMLHSTLGWVY